MDIDNYQSFYGNQVITIETRSVNSDQVLKLQLKKIEVIFEGLFIDSFFGLLSPMYLGPIQNALTRIV
jgi:hypothetical protein